MLNRISAIGIVALGAMALPHAALAADYYDEGARPPAHHWQDSENDLRFDRGGDVRPRERSRYDHAPAVVYDERGGARHRQDGWDGPVGPADEDGRGYDGPAYGGRFGGGPWPHRGPGWGPGPYVVEPVPVGPLYGAARGFPDVGCTIEQSQSTTPVGWRKIVTHRTCYRR